MNQFCFAPAALGFGTADRATRDLPVVISGDLGCDPSSQNVTEPAPHAAAAFRSFSRAQRDDDDGR